MKNWSYFFFIILWSSFTLKRFMKYSKESQNLCDKNYGIFLFGYFLYFIIHIRLVKSDFVCNGFFGSHDWLCISMFLLNGYIWIKKKRSWFSYLTMFRFLFDGMKFLILTKYVGPFIFMLKRLPDSGLTKRIFHKNKKKIRNHQRQNNKRF